MPWYQHIPAQWPTIRTLVRAAASRAPRTPDDLASALPPLPGPWLEDRLPPRSPSLIRDYIRFSGGEPGYYRNTLPPHLFPQWAFVLSTRALSALPLPLTRGLNAGAVLEPRRPLAADVPLHVRARLERAEVTRGGVLAVVAIHTGTSAAADDLYSEFRVYIPIPGKKREKETGKTPPRVPADARELDFLRVSSNAGLRFAGLTGDINPIHWIPPAARAAGFKGCILHGFATFALANEALVRGALANDPSGLQRLEARFLKPLPLPSKVGVYLTADRAELLVGDAPSGGVYLQAQLQLKNNV